ncbi:MAG: beta-lactamase family protein [Thaumarchaeota archaeon]|nr:beta-lactamase family protein [Nitrososphaerota archaeon]
MMSGSAEPARTLRTASPQEVGMSGPRLSELSSLLQEWVDKEDARTQAIEVLVARRGGIVFHEAFGRLTPAADSPKTPLRTIFRLASITKVLTATALMTLVDDGRVGLNRPVVEYVPEFKGEGKATVLVRHLLTHTSGLNEPEVEKFAHEHLADPVTPPPDSTIHPLIHRWYSLRYGAPLWKPPGTEMSYADFNFELAGEIVRRVSGMALDRFAESRIFRPLGMMDTHYCRADVPPERLVQRPPDPEDPAMPADPVMDEIGKVLGKERVFLASGLAASTAPDMAVLGQMFLNKGRYGSTRVLSPASVAAMTRNQIPGVKATFLEQYFPEASWGLGWSVHGSKTGLTGGLQSPSSFEHWGAGGPYIWVDPELDLIGVYFASIPNLPDISEENKFWRNDLFTDAVTAAVEDP